MFSFFGEKASHNNSTISKEMMTHLLQGNNESEYGHQKNDLNISAEHSTAIAFNTVNNY